MTKKKQDLYKKQMAHLMSTATGDNSSSDKAGSGGLMHTIPTEPNEVDQEPQILVLNQEKPTKQKKKKCC